MLAILLIAILVLGTMRGDDNFYGLVDVSNTQFACGGAQCTYAIDNILQLHACGSAVMLGTDSVEDMMKCEVAATNETCQAVGKCHWIPNDDDYPKSMGDGACAHKNFDEYMVASGIQVFYEALINTGMQNPPAAPELYDCLIHSLESEAKCIKQKDRKERPCAWCSNVASAQLGFTTPAIRNICTQKEWLDVSCPLLRRTAPPCIAPSTSTVTPSPQPTAKPGSTAKSSSTAKPGSTGSGSVSPNATSSISSAFANMTSTTPWNSTSTSAMSMTTYSVVTTIGSVITMSLSL